MNKRNIFNITKFNLKVNKANILGWFISIFLIMLIYMLFFPTIKDIGTVKMELMPKEVLKLFGLNTLNDMNNFISYFGMIFTMILVAIAIFATTFSAKLICKEENTKSIEFLDSLNINRKEIYYSKVLTAFIATTIVLLGALIATLIGGLVSGGNTFILKDFIVIIKICSLPAYIFIGVAFLIAGITSRINVSSISSVIALTCYMIGYLGVLIEKKWVTYFSPFEALSPNKTLHNDNLLIFIIYFILMIIFIIIGNKFYTKRDFNI